MKFGYAITIAPNSANIGSAPSPTQPLMIKTASELEVMLKNTKIKYGQEGLLHVFLNGKSYLAMGFDIQTDKEGAEPNFLGVYSWPYHEDGEELVALPLVKHALEELNLEDFDSYSAKMKGKLDEWPWSDAVDLALKGEEIEYDLISMMFDDLKALLFKGNDPLIGEKWGLEKLEYTFDFMFSDSEVETLWTDQLCKDHLEPLARDLVAKLAQGKQ